MVVIELKAGDFKTSYLGQLMGYLTMGVATYKTMADMPEHIRKALPDVEELKKLL